MAEIKDEKLDDRMQKAIKGSPCFGRWFKDENEHCKVCHARDYCKTETATYLASKIKPTAAPVTPPIATKEEVIVAKEEKVQVPEIKKEVPEVGTFAEYLKQKGIDSGVKGPYERPKGVKTITWFGWKQKKDVVVLYVDNPSGEEKILDEMKIAYKKRSGYIVTDAVNNDTAFAVFNSYLAK